MKTTQTTTAKKPTKYIYYRTIQENWGQGWEHVDFYPCNSAGTMDKETKAQFMENLKAYRANSGAPVRTSSTKELRTN